MSATRLQTVFLGLGIVLELVAMIFGSNAIVHSGISVANIAGAGAACGLGIAGGLCFIAAAITNRGQP